jgi:hypothetical protein
LALKPMGLIMRTLLEDCFSVACIAGKNNIANETNQ